MSFFPTADPDKLREAMANNNAYYNIPQNDPYSIRQPDFKDDSDVKATWYDGGSVSQGSYHHVMSHSMAWPGSSHNNLGSSALPTPTQATFDPAYANLGHFATTTPWMPSGPPMSSSTAYATGATHEAPLDPSFSLPTPMTASMQWQPLASDSSTYVSVYDSPPSRSEYSTGSHSIVDSSPYAHSDSCFQTTGSPFIKVEDSADSHRPRLYSVPGLQSFDRPLHVNPGDVYTSPPPVSAVEHQSVDVPQAPAKVEEDEDEDAKPFVIPPRLRRPRARRAISDGPDMTCLRLRQKRGFTTEAEATCKCKLCNKKFARTYNLKAHMLTHDPQREIPHVCMYPGCEKRFVRKTDLLRHETSVHLKQRNFQCQLCYSKFARKDTLSRHVDDGCPKRPEMKKRAQRAAAAEVASSAGPSSSSQFFEPFYQPDFA